MNGSDLIQTNVLSGLGGVGVGEQEREGVRERQSEQVSVADLCVSLWSQSESVKGSYVTSAERLGALLMHNRLLESSVLMN